MAADVSEERAAIVNAAAELLKAAILLRDMTGAMPMAVQLNIPEDILRRMTWHGYQGAFDRLPTDVREEALATALCDEWVIAARAIDQASRS